MATKKIQKDRQPSSKHAHKTKDRVIRIPTENRGEHFQIIAFFILISHDTGTIKQIIDQLWTYLIKWLRIYLKIRIIIEIVEYLVSWELYVLIRRQAGRQAGKQTDRQTDMKLTFCHDIAEKLLNWR